MKGIIVAVIKGQDDGAWRQGASIVHGVKELVKGDGVIALQLEVVKLLREHFHRDGQAFAECRGRHIIRDMVVHHDGMGT